jgi:hypothetical protein
MRMRVMMRRMMMEQSERMDGDIYTSNASEVTDG